jgi:CDP-paratose 2-epimerase
MSKRALVTGGAGFIGSNLINVLLNEGLEVTAFDAFLRRGSQHNVSWLQHHPNAAHLRVVKGDVRNLAVVGEAVAGAEIVYHLAGQVAVTSSVLDPRTDFEINALGTLNVLEAARLAKPRPVLVFTSTNKVYGGMEDVDVAEERQRYCLRDYPGGVPETRPLDFHSPYGCSKGAADQYVRDYARIYGLRTVVFRMSCIYGPRQFGTEDQGWVAHFIISALTGKPITIYGDGKQVRDVLFVDDLVRAFRLADRHIDDAAGEVFNIGGGPANAMSVWAEFGQILTALSGEDIAVDFDDWRPGDQPCYISDIAKAGERLGWKPLITKEEGVHRLWDWASSNLDLFEERRLAS